MPNNKLEITQRALERERLARKAAEAILEEKALELYELNEQLKATNNFLEKLNKKQTSQLDGMLDSLLDAYILMELNGNVLEMNAAAKQLLGYNLDEEKLNVVHLIFKEDYLYAMNAYQKLIKNGFFKDYNARIYTKSKKIRRVHINASLVYDNSGKPIGAQGIVRDITKQTEQQEVFETQKQQLSVIFDNSPIGIALTQNGIFLESNKVFQDLINYSNDELKQMSIKDVSLAEDFPTSANYLKQLEKREINQFIVTKRYVRKDKTIVWARTNVGAVRDSNGAIQYQVALIEDITEEYNEAQLKKQLLADLEKSNSELNDFAHVISHDLKSPLRSMNTLIYWLQEDYNQFFDANAKDILNKLSTKVEKMDNLIGGVLEYSRIDKIKQPSEKVAIQQLVGDIINVIFIPSTIKIEIPKTLPVILGDRFRLYQLFQNLLNNGVSYIDNPNGWVKITFEEKEKYWKFYIEDNGIGIEEKYQKKIFEVFQSLKKSEHSTGIGLSIVKKIVTYYGGEIGLTSKVGKGTCFYFTLLKEPNL